MTVKVNGGVKAGMFFEKKVAFVTITFGAAINAAGSDSSFGYPDTVLDNVVQKLVQNKAVVLGVSGLYSSGTKVDLILGTSQAWTSNASGQIMSAVAVTGKTYDANGVANGTQSTTATVVFSKFEGLTAAAAGDLTEFPAGSGAYFVK